jgi:Fe-S cluster biosynthesis and repair protein YggX
MKRIYDFSSFSKIYEAEENKEKPYLGLLKQILSYINTSYMSQLKLTEDPYDAKIITDLDSVAKAPGVDSYKKILANVKAAVDKDSAEAKVAGESWTAAGEKFIAALGKIIEKLPNNKEEIEKSITDFINVQKQNLQSSSKENDLKKEVEQALSKKNESFEYINEGIFTGKKGRIKDISKEITVVMSILKDMSAIPGMEGEAKKYQDEVTKLSAEVGKMVDMKGKDIDGDRLKEIGARISEIPTLLTKKSEGLAKEDETNKEAAALFVDALKSLEAATEKDKKFVEKAKVEKEAEDNWNKSAKDAIGFKGTIKMEDVKGKKDKTVKSFQQEVIKKFKDVIKGSDDFSKFADGKFAGDGYFGDNTAKIIKGLKAGFGMDDKTSDITDEFLNKVFSYSSASKQNESVSFGRFKSFTDFEQINEAKIKFDVNKFLEATGEKKAEEKKDLPTPGELLDELKKTVEEVYNDNKEGVDYILGKDFEPSEEGKKLFRTIFRTSWDNFSKYNEIQKKNTVAMGLKSTIMPTTGVKKGIDKDLLDIYLKKEGEKK